MYRGRQRCQGSLIDSRYIHGTVCLHTQGDHIPFRTVTEQGQNAQALRSVLTFGIRPHQQPDPNLVLLPSA